MKVTTRLEWGVVVALACFAFMNALLWATIIPLGDAPDEYGHFEVVAFELIFKRIPEVGVDDYGALAKVALDDYRTPVYSYSAQPGLSYIISAATVALLSPDDGPDARAARYPGAVWAALMTIAVFVGVREMFPDGQAGVAILAATLATCWPQLAFVFSYINNDGLTAVGCAALIASWYVGRNAGWRYRDLVVLGFFGGLVLLNKPNGFPLVVVAGLVLTMTLSGRRGARLRKAATAVGVGLITCGWWYLIAYSRYGWDLLATGRADAFRRQLGVEWASGRYYGMGPIRTAFDAFPRFGETWIHGTLRTAVGAFGELTIALPGRSYAIIGGLTCLAIIGASWVMWSRRRESSGGIDLVHSVTFFLIPALIGLALYRSWTFDFQAQGRYLFPAMLPYVALVSFGLLAPFSRLPRAVIGSCVTITLFSVLVQAFFVRLLGAYRLMFGDVVGASPVMASLWVASLLIAVGASALFWLRMGMEASGARVRTQASLPSPE